MMNPEQRQHIKDLERAIGYAISIQILVVFLLLFGLAALMGWLMGRLCLIVCMVVAAIGFGRWLNAIGFRFGRTKQRSTEISKDVELPSG